MNAGDQLIAEGRIAGRADGRVEGRAEGRAEGLRDAITHVLAARRLALSDPGRARLASCASVSVLTVWLERAATAASEAEVFASSDGA